MKLKMSWATVLVVVCGTAAAFAWSRVTVTDEAAVADAELIVVATLIPESIRKIEHAHGENEGRSWHHRARLRIIEVLKGKPAEKCPEVILHYGLDPVTGHCLSANSAQSSQNGREARVDPEVIRIWDTGGLDIPITEDVRKPHLWLLSRKGSGFSTADENDAPGVREPVHLQAIAKKEALVKIIQAQANRRSAP